MLDFLKLFVHILASPFKSQARLEAEIVVLRQQLMVLRRRSPSKPKLTVADRLLFVWLYRLFPSVLNAHDHPARDRHAMATRAVRSRGINSRPLTTIMRVHRAGDGAGNGAS